MENISYVKLTDARHKGTVVRMQSIGRPCHERYKNGEWVKTSLMMEYHHPDGYHFEDYVEITEEEANRLISSDSYVSYEDFDFYDTEASLELLDQMFMIAEQLPVPKGIERIMDFDITQKND